jgi:hypothetical protein
MVPGLDLVLRSSAGVNPGRERFGGPFVIDLEVMTEHAVSVCSY